MNLDDRSIWGDNYRAFCYSYGADTPEADSLPVGITEGFFIGESMELLVVNGTETMDSRDIAKLCKKRHDNVMRDIESQIPALSFESGYFDKNNQIRKCYKLPYRETMIIMSGYSVELRTIIIDRWIKLEKKRKTIRDDSKKTRNSFTELLKDHGYDKQHHYIQITIQMKKALGITSKKDNMTELELKKVRASEALIDLLISDQEGFYEVNPVCVSGCNMISETVAKRRMLK